MLTVLQDPASATQWCREQRELNQTIGFVPTMGALHEGHLSLVKRAIDENDVTCVSIFVNPLQFNEADDYSNYPRDIDLDYRLLDEVGCDMVFGGTNRDMFPEAESIKEVTILDPGQFATGLEGEFRPGHLEGVCTVVERLFKFTGDCRAYFGLKDYQQTLVVRDLANNLGYPEIRTCETVRDKHGLALSSRNALLSKSELALATNISKALYSAKVLWDNGCRECDQLRAAMRDNLPAPLRVEYADVRDPENWQANSPVGTINHAIALIAARVGEVRLIDNLQLDSRL